MKIVCDNKGEEKAPIAPEVLQSYREKIDFIYTLTKDEPFLDGFSSFGDAKLSRIATHLVGIKVLEKKRLGKYKYSYKWAASMAPTPVFYKNVTEAMLATQMQYCKNARDRKKEESKPAPEATPANVSLKAATDQELWGELKSRGYTIEGEKLVKIVRTELK